MWDWQRVVCAVAVALRVDSLIALYIIVVDMVPTPVVMRKYFLQTYNEVTSEPGLSYPLWRYRLAYADIMVAALCARQA